MCNPHNAIRTIQSSRCNPHDAISRINLHCSIPRGSTQDAISKCNLHDVIPCNDTIRTMQSHTKQFNPHDAIPRTRWSYARCNPMHDAIPRTMQSHVRCNSTKPLMQALQYNKGRPMQMVHGGVDKKGKRHFAIFTYLLSTKCHP